MITLNTGDVPYRPALERILENDLELASLLPEPALRQKHLQRELDRLRRLVDQRQASILSSDDGALVIRWLDWDSAHFGVPCADLFRLYADDRTVDSSEIKELYDAAETELEARGIRFVSARLRTDQKRALSELRARGFDLLDTSIELGSTTTALSCPSDVRPACSADEAAAVRISESFMDNRFFRDPRIADELAAGVYASWVRNALDAGQMTVVERDGEVAGLATFSIPDEWLQVATIGLVIVAPRFRGKGVFGPLIAGCRRQVGGVAAVTSTQATNARALRAFARCDLLPFGSRHVLHCWL